MAMRSDGRSLLQLLGLSSLAWAAAFVLCACSSDASTAPSDAGDGGAPSDAIAASDSGDGSSDGNGDPSRNGDPQDLDPTNGDPSLDIAGSWIYFDANQPWIRAEFFGSWPPPATLYAWSCSVYLGTANAPVVTYTVQSLAGTQTDTAEGIDKAKITFAIEPKGFRVLFADATLQFDRYALECTVKKSNTGTLVQDASGAFEVKTKEPRAFGP